MAGAADGGADSSGEAAGEGFSASGGWGRYIGREWADDRCSAFRDPPTAAEIAMEGYDPQPGCVAPYPQYPDGEGEDAPPASGATSADGGATSGGDPGGAAAPASRSFSVGSFLYVDNWPGRG